MNSVPEDRHPVGDGINFIQPVTDVNDSNPLRPQFPDHPEQTLHFARSQSRSRFVHHNNPSILGKSFGNLDHLLFGHRQFSARLFRINLHSNALKQLQRFFPFLGTGNKTKTRGLLPEKNILSGRQTGNQIEFLINHSDTRSQRILRSLDTGDSSIDFNRSLVREMGTSNYLDQSAFPCSVFTKQSQDFA